MGITFNVDPGKSKISDFETIIFYENVLWFDISVNDIQFLKDW